MDKKQQFIEKKLKEIMSNKFITALALELPAEVYDDFIKEIAKVIHLQLSECWDMAEKEWKKKIEESTKEYIEHFSLTSQKEGKKG